MSKVQAESPVIVEQEGISWFGRLREARTGFQELSRGELELMSSVYGGDDQRHQVLHHACGNYSWISMRELEDLSPEQVCPHCHSTDHLSRFGTLEELQVSVYRESGDSVYFYASNPMGPADQSYIFWCVRHARPFESAFSEFQRTKGGSNGCPLCADVETSGND